MKNLGMLVFGMILVIVSLLILTVSDNAIGGIWPVIDPITQTGIGIFLGVVGLILVYLSRKKA